MQVYAFRIILHKLPIHSQQRPLELLKNVKTSATWLYLKGIADENRNDGKSERRESDQV